MVEHVPSDRSEEVAPETAFSLLTDEIRIDIIRALGHTPGYTASFSTLQEQVGIADSGLFNYHLQKLTDHFIRHTGNGYTLQYAGRLIHRAILARMFTKRPQTTPVELQDGCPVCGATLESSYIDGRHRVTCPDCGSVSFMSGLHPAGLDGRTLTEILDASARLSRHGVALAMDGICTHCSGIVTPTIITDSTRPFGQPFADHRCENCGLILTTNIGEALLSHPVVISFLHDHDVDLRTKRTWELPFCVDDEYLIVLSEDPWQIMVSIPVGDEELRVTVDGNLNVLEFDRDNRS